MNCTPKKLLKKVSILRKQSFPVIRDKRGLPLEEGKALTSKGVVNLSASRGLHRGAQGLGYNSGLERLKCASGGIQSDKTPCLFFPPLSTRVRLLEQLIHDLTLKGDALGLRRALKEYVLTWVEMAKGRGR